MFHSKEKRERSLGEHLNLKATRCSSPKCAMVRRPYRPGVHGKGRFRRTISDFGRQLREKQKVKVTYGLDERNLRQLFDTARRRRGSTADVMLELLERRLDNVLYRLGFAPSRAVARQLVVHGHITVNGIRARSPWLELSPSDIVGIRSESKSRMPFQNLKDARADREMPSWLAVDPEQAEGRVIGLPTDTNVPFELSLLVESFSK